MNEKNWLPAKDYEFVFHKTPRLCVDLIIVTPKGFILTRRDIEPYKGTWGFPGGRVYYEESLAQAIRRIGLKEAGVKVSNEKFLGFMEMRDETFRLKNFVHTISLGFLVDYVSGEIHGCDEGKEIDVFQEVPANTHPYHHQFLTEHFSEILAKL